MDHRPGWATPGRHGTRETHRVYPEMEKTKRHLIQLPQVTGGEA